MTNKLPQGWVGCKLEDFVAIMDNYRKPVNADEREQRLKKATQTYPYYGATGQVGLIDDYIFEGEAVLLGEDGAPFLDPYKNKAYMVYGQYWVNNHAHILQGLGGISNKFICYFLNSISYYQYVSGTTRLKLNQAALKQIKCNLPPLKEQKRIVAKIEEEFGKIDEGVEKLKLAQEQIKQYRQSVLKSAFDGKLYKTTEWEEKTLEEIASKISDGSHNPPPKQTSGKVMISGQNIKNNKIIFDDFRFITEEDFLREYKRTPIEANDILLTIVGSIGQSAVVPDDIQDFTLQRSVALIKSLINSYYLKYYLDAPKAQHYFKTKARGTAQKGVYLNTLKELKVIIPSEDEQKQIVKEIEMRFEVADEVERVITENLEKAEQLKQSILENEKL